MLLRSPASMLFFAYSSLLLLLTEGLVFSTSKEQNIDQAAVGRIPVFNGGKNLTTMSEIGCGTWSWGNRLLWDYDTSQDEEIYQAYQLVRKAGVTFFDTADSYGTLELNGRAEQLLGQFERRYQQEIMQSNFIDDSDTRNNNRPWWDITGKKFIPKQQTSVSELLNIEQQQQQQVATKFAPYPWRLSRKNYIQAAKNSLNRLEQDTLAIAQAHWSTVNYLPQQESAVWEGLADCYDAGLAYAVGVSNYGPKRLIKVAKRMKEREVPLATAQIQYSLMTYEVATQMNQACNEVDCRLIAYSPLCLGLLTGKYNLDHLPRPGNPRRQLFRELLAPKSGTQDLINTIEAIALEYGKTNSQVAINWTLCKGTVPIPGCHTVQQAKENIGATGWRLGDDAVSELERVAKAVKKPMIQNIFQTT